jgi:hypothetical protein
MTPIRVLAVVLIFLATTVAWFILGTSLAFRTEGKTVLLGARVEDSWGGTHVQAQPRFFVYETVLDTVTETTTNATGQTTQTRKTVRRRIARDVEAVGSDIGVELAVDYRQKGLLWYSVYSVSFEGTYRVRNTSPSNELYVRFDFPSNHALFDDFVFRVDGKDVDDARVSYEEVPDDASGSDPSGRTWSAPHAMTAHVPLELSKEARITIRYRSQGTGVWQYRFGEHTSRVRNFRLSVHTHFKDFDIPEACLSPAQREATDDGWKLTWAFTDVISNVRIGIDMPKKLNPGPVAQRISFFAPVSLLFFFTMLLIVGALRDRNIHPMNYFFLAAAFFAFHLFFAYLVDHVRLGGSFALASATSVLLVATYMRLVCGWAFTLRAVVPTQIVYLVLFSYSFFFEGYTGLTITIGAILTLFVLMQITGRTDWGTLMRKKKGT